ncbi:MAG: matrixin family metalloprotease, partial [Pseudolabrys sp.]|nr:matrixin family metalloprotease [Pseudolabrys sp.]
MYSVPNRLWRSGDNDLHGSPVEIAASDGNLDVFFIPAWEGENSGPPTATQFIVNSNVSTGSLAGDASFAWDIEAAAKQPVWLEAQDASTSDPDMPAALGTLNFVESADGSPDQSAVAMTSVAIQAGPVLPIAGRDAQDAGPPATPSQDELFPLADVNAGISSASNAGKPVGTIPQLANYLLQGFWTYAGEIAHHWSVTTLSYNIEGLTAAERSLAQSALNAWHEITNLSFTRTTGAANVTFNHSGTMQAYETDSFNGSGIMSSATVDISADWITTDGGANDGKTGIDSYGYQTYIHEIGHALGLGHQGPYNGS